VLGESDSDDTVIIPTVKHKGEVLESKEVSKKWWDHEEKAEAVAERFRSRFADVPGIDGIGIGTSSDRIAGRKGSEVIIFTNPDRTPTVETPDQAEGVPVVRKESYNPEPDCYEGDYDTVPGGAQVEGDGTASATCPVQMPDGTDQLMTCAHLYNRCQSNPVGEPLYQSGQFVGLIDTGSVRQDWVTSPLDDNAQVNGFDNTIAGTFIDVTGYVTRSGLKDLKSTDQTVYKNGITSCETSGVVEELDVNNRMCQDTSYESVSYEYAKTSTPTDPGDSGSPHYKEFTFNGETKASIIMPHYGGESVGCPAYRINEVHGIQFGI
jgi:hypothetical protein